MKLILKDGRRHILRFDRGEEVREGLKRFCAENGILAGYFSGIGALSKITLSSYDIEKKAYNDKTFEDELEITSFTGNVSALDGETVIHAHGTFGDPKFKTLAGHVKEAVVSATCEMVLIAFEGEVRRKFSTEIGLNLLE